MFRGSSPISPFFRISAPYPCQILAQCFHASLSPSFLQSQHFSRPPLTTKSHNSKMASLEVDNFVILMRADAPSLFFTVNGLSPCSPGLRLYYHPVLVVFATFSRALSRCDELMRRDFISVKSARSASRYRPKTRSLFKCRHFLTRYG